MSEPVSFPVIHPDNKTRYENEERVEVVLDGREPVYTGRIIGIASSGLLDHWIVMLDEKLDSWPFQAVALQHTFIRRAGSNMPFLCMVAGKERASS